MNGDTKSLRHPFGTSDFLGYLIPGSLLALGLCAFDRLFFKGGSQHSKVIFDLLPRKADLLNPYVFPLALAIGVILVYTAGHLISSLSSGLIDRMLVDRIGYYPYVNLLSPLFHKEHRERLKRQYSKAAFFSFLIGCLLLGILTIHLWVLCLTGGLVAGILLCRGLLSNHLNRLRRRGDRTSRIRAHAFRTRRPSPALFRMALKRRLKARLQAAGVGRGTLIIDGIFFWVNEAVGRISDLCGLTFGTSLRLLRIGQPFPKKFCCMFRKRFIEIYGTDPNKLQTNVFWLAAMYVVGNRPNQTRLAHYAYNIVTFTRNVAMESFLLFCYGVIMFAQMTPDYQHKHVGYYVAWLWITGLAAFFFGLRYYNTYYNHYTKLILRAFVSRGESAVFEDNSCGEPPAGGCDHETFGCDEAGVTHP